MFKSKLFFSFFRKAKNPLLVLAGVAVFAAAGSAIYAQTQQSGGSDTTITIPTNASPGTTYTVRVDVVGNSPSGEQQTVPLTATITVPTVPPTTQNVPETPTGFQALPGPCDSRQINLSWNASNGAASYVVKRNDVQVYSGSNTFFSDSGLVAGTSYSYTVIAKNSVGSSGAASISATAPAACTVGTPPPTPTNFQAAPQTCGTGRINLSWNASSGATSYTLSRDGFVIYTGPNLSFSDGGLAAGSSHSYTVTASNASGTSAPASASAKAPVTCDVPLYSLFVAKGGTGSGTVTSNPAGISCGSDCSENYALGAYVTLTASPSFGSTFAGWSGACSGTGACSVSMSSAKSVTATFNSNGGTAAGCTLSANPGIGVAPLSGTLSWTTTGSPTSCTASGGWSGAKSVSGGSQGFGPINNTTSYTLSCSNASGSGSCSATAAISIPVQLSCSPFTQNVSVNQPASLQAVGGNGSYSWSAPGGSPSSGIGSSFSTTYQTEGTKTVTVSSGGSVHSCVVNIAPPPQPPQWGVNLQAGTGTSELGTVWYESLNGTAPLNGVRYRWTLSKYDMYQAYFWCNQANGTTDPSILPPPDRFITSAYLGYPQSSFTTGHACNYSSPGTYYLKMIAGQPNIGGVRVQDIVPITVTSATNPDLTAAAPTPANAVAGTATTFSSVISNIGDGSTGAGFNNFFQVATAAGGGGTISDVPFALSSAVPTLAAGGTGTASASYTFASQGTYSMRACADKSSSSNSGTVTESNENNNCSGWTDITVGSGVVANNASVNITANSQSGSVSIPVGTAATLRWAYSKATSCSITPPASIGSYPDGSGTVSTGNLTASRTYTISCDPGGVSSSVSVNIQSSPTRTLNVIKTGQGTVASSPAGINCGSGCSSQSYSFPSGTAVSLTAVAAPGRIFTGWNGACTGKDGCSVTLDVSKTVYANFAADPNYKEF